MKGFDLDHVNDAYRDDIDVLRQELQDLGATHVLTYDELDDKKAVKAKVKEWTNGQVYYTSIQITGTSAC
jgi:trans-2-enoyl-CoA reductase